MFLGILDRYIIKKYLKSFFFTVLLFTLIAVAIDFADKVDSYISEPVTVREIIFDYTFKFILHINSLLWPLFALISVIFFTSRMAFDSEIISILNAGISYRRLLFPYLVSASIIAGLLMLANHTIVPKGNKTRINFEQTYVWKDQDKGKKENIHMFVGPHTKIFIERFNQRDSVATGVRLEEYEGNHITYILKARRMKWKGLPGNWQLEGYVGRTIDGEKEYLNVGLRKKMDTLIHLTPKDFVQYLNEKEQMSTTELNAAIAKQIKRGLGTPKKFKIEVLRRTSEPFSIIILTLIGVAVSARKVRGGMGLHLAVGIGLGALFIFVSKFSTTFAFNSSFPAIYGVWLPNIIFLAIAIILSIKAQM
ncbi:MAG TPA: YjgP/YjgQ family permease [Saprospiraceae bacterium]|nr:YjgP/YjgQ family permease [Saprospiraceae bacterium]